MELHFTTDYTEIAAKINNIDPVKYGQTRNYINGAVTYLSPYIARGVISTKQVLEIIVAKGYKIPQIESFVKELCWRDYFQRVAQTKNINQEIKQPQAVVSNYEISTNIINATTGIEGIDTAIQQLYLNGYMHNHCRMYTAALVCNIAKSHWLLPAQWMYYHLLDGDWASNACSWQWVAGANSSKKYYANQENINRYTNTNQHNTYLDKPYEVLEGMETPDLLSEIQKPVFKTTLPESNLTQIDNDLPTFIYNYYNLDPLWHKEEPGNRILLIEPHFFQQYPISEKCTQFMLSLSNNIPDIQLYVGSFKSLVETYSIKDRYYKEHPLNIGYSGKMENRDWISNEVTGYFPSFFSYWKKIEKQLKD
jgi:deoxyribodipyrimidine photo-lyase